MGVYTWDNIYLFIYLYVAIWSFTLWNIRHWKTTFNLRGDISFTVFSFKEIHIQTILNFVRACKATPYLSEDELDKNISLLCKYGK